ncbi:MAG: glycoside hydrolase family 2 TIM barrel-domain containing protein [Cyclobacteriaceae bacterium]
MKRNILIVAIGLMAFACQTSEKDNTSKGPIEVKIVKADSGFQLLRGGESYFIKGARTIGTQHMDRVASVGGNSVRIGSQGDIMAKLDTAHKYGLSVLFGLPVQSERNGFDYNDTSAVQDQFENVMQLVEKYKEHPAILMWAIGNELDYVPAHPENYNLKLWDAINEIAKAINATDPYHPAITVVGTGRKIKMADIVERTPDLDALGINSYGDIYQIPDWVREYNLNKPYLITEWGPTGHWQVETNKWGLPVEETTSEKADRYLERHEELIEADPFCLGGYSFLWTQGRQERTHTWYNMFFDTGEETEAVEVMQYVWTGEWPENRAPRIDSVTLNQQPKNEDISLQSGSTYQASVQASDKDKLTYEWELYPENTEFGYAGQGETRPGSMNDLLLENNKSSITLKAPADSGNYRLFVYVRDEGNNIAIANIPFHVE